jgi:prepilin-type N-terminal cleavage/methylation domain-containing protein
MRKRSGFTLIELLVVVAIISVLLALLLPTLASVRENAKLVACMSNLRQIRLGLQMYRDDYGDYLPPMSSPASMPNTSDAWCDWVGVLRQTRNIMDFMIFRCPSDVVNRNLTVLGEGNLTISYGINEYLTHPYPGWRPRVSGVPERPDTPAIDLHKAMPVIADSCYPAITGYQRPFQARVANANFGLNAFPLVVDPDPAYRRHRGGSVILFLDDRMEVVSQVKAMDFEYVHYSRFWW